MGVYMAFNIIEHIQDHAEYVKIYDKNISLSNSLHFTVSFLDLYFIALKIDFVETLKLLLKDIREESIYNEKNGFYISKNNKKTQKFSKRVINLGVAIKAEAIHIKNSRDDETQPHFHFILNKKSHLGKNYSLLKRHISTKASKYGIIPHFDASINYNSLAIRNLEKACRKFSWSISKLSAEQFKAYMKKDIAKQIELLQQYTQKTGNLTYYIKTMNTLKRRLTNQRISYLYKSKDIREIYEIPLNKIDKKCIQILQQRKYDKDTLKCYIQNPILRDFARLCVGREAIVIKTLKEFTYELDNLRKNKTFLENYLTLFKQTDQTKKAFQKDNQYALQISKILPENTIVNIAYKTEKIMQERNQHYGIIKKRRQLERDARKFVQKFGTATIIAKRTATNNLSFARSLRTTATNNLRHAEYIAKQSKKPGTVCVGTTTRKFRKFEIKLHEIIGWKTDEFEKNIREVFDRIKILRSKISNQKVKSNIVAGKSDEGSILDNHSLIKNCKDKNYSTKRKKFKF